jgi:hypothetical protein
VSPCRTRKGKQIYILKNHNKIYNEERRSKFLQIYSEARAVMNPPHLPQHPRGGVVLAVQAKVPLRAKLLVFRPEVEINLKISGFI